ncbi:hypothetical protein [Pseudomonas sp. URMO17WK12:I11]|uniref:hypothetical protein n=1 Tax=Pseudomonas sp. URMO17WK12:I11 TaxID=1283291 RepID=UPI0007212F40|nr:hypothetical protein [Pseudomonas sp. URMO17WK12:I11]CRL50735.1 hypothetical protein PSHI_38930 [Pseudomonas sp. URMO17WK12:I11]
MKRLYSGVERWQMRFNSFQDFDDVLARQLNHERHKPRFMHGDNPFQITLTHMTIVVRCQKTRIKNALGFSQVGEGALMILMIKPVGNDQFLPHRS